MLLMSLRCAKWRASSSCGEKLLLFERDMIKWNISIELGIYRELTDPSIRFLILGNRFYQDGAVESLY